MGGLDRKGDALVWSFSEPITVSGNPLGRLSAERRRNLHISRKVQFSPTQKGIGQKIHTIAREKGLHDPSKEEEGKSRQDKE